VIGRTTDPKIFTLGEIVNIVIANLPKSSNNTKPSFFLLGISSLLIMSVATFPG